MQDVQIDHLLHLGLPPFVVTASKNESGFESPSSAEAKPILSYNRKEKSLSELARKFI